MKTPGNSEIDWNQEILNNIDVQHAFDRLSQCIITCNEKGDVLSANKAVSIFGVAVSELIGANLNDYVQDPDQSLHPQVGKLRDAGQPTQIHYSVPVRGKRKDGEDFPCLLSVSELPGSVQAQRRFLMIVEVPSEQDQLDELIRRSHRLESVEKKISRIGHEFSNVLSIISGSFEILQLIVEENPQVHKWLTSGLEAVHRSSLLSQQLSDILKERTSNVRPLNINDALTGMRKVFQKSLPETVVTKYEMQEDIWDTKIDVFLFEYSLASIIQKSSDRMLRSGEIIIRTANQILTAEALLNQPKFKVGEYVVVSVYGNSLKVNETESTIRSSDIDQVKEKSTSHSIVVDEFMNQSQGFVEVEDGPGEHPAIHLYFPRYESPRTETSARRTDPVVEDEGQTILVVEDEYDLRKITVRQLQDLGYKTLEAENASVAQEILAGGHRIDLLFTDLMMPGEVDGYELCRRTVKTYPEIKLLISSGYAGDRLVNATEHRRRELDEVNPQLLVKPYTQDDLANAIGNVLGKEI